MPRGGKRTPSPGKKLGRPKTEAEDTSMGKGFATDVFRRFGELKTLNPELKVKSAEDYALQILAKDDAEAHTFFRYMLDRKYGKPAQSVITSDNRETIPDLDFGNLVMPAAPRKPGTAGKPN